MMNKMTKTTKKRNLFFQSKKANAFLDLMTVMLILIGFAICSIIGYRIFNDFTSKKLNFNKFWGGGGLFWSLLLKKVL